MDPERPDLRSSLQALAAVERRRLAAHLEPEQLLAYRAGELSDAETETVRDHLALCPECAELLLDFDQFTPEASSAARAAISDDEIESAWTALRDRLAREGQSPTKAPSRPAVRPGPGEAAVRRKGLLPLVVPAARRPSPGLAYALAASLAACLGLSVWGGILHGRLQAATGRGEAVPVAVFAGPTRGEATEEIVSLPKKVHYFGLRVPHLRSLPFPLYRAVLVRQSHPAELLIPPIDDLQVDGEGGVTLNLPVASFPPDSYLLRLFGAEGGAWAKVADYPFRTIDH